MTLEGEMLQNWKPVTIEEAEEGVYISGLDTSKTYLIIGKNRYHDTYSSSAYLMWPERDETTLYFYGSEYFAFKKGQIKSLTEKALQEAEEAFVKLY